MSFYSRYIFPWVLDWAMSRAPMREQRPIVLAAVEGVALEIGFGTGLNLAHYPPHVERLTVVDPNPGMQHLARQRVGASQIPVDWIGLVNGERLDAPDESFDCVVSTWTLCSVRDAAQVLAEIHRVLKPGGRFMFIEHGLSPDPRVAKWQHRLNGINQLIGVGCNLNRDIVALIRQSPFLLGSCEQFYLERTLRIGGYTSRGIAQRPGT